MRTTIDGAGRVVVPKALRDRLQLTGGAAYDGVLALTAAAHRAELLTRDRRAATTHEALGVRYRLLAD